MCANCAWRANCNKRFSVASGADGQVICFDHSFDIELLKKNKEE
jgi:hypothetical protein